MTQHKQHSNKWLGVILIIIGALFLLDTFNILNFGRLFSNWWPVIFILIGLFKLQGQDRGAGIVFIVIGMILLLITHDVISWHRIWRLWPLILILIGLSLVLKSRRFIGSSVKDSTIGNDFIKTNAIFGSAEHVITSQYFKGGEIMALFGGVEIDLRSAKLASEECKIHATALFGGVELIVPKDWNIILTGSPIFGGIENKKHDSSKAEPERTVYIHCTVALGGVEIK